MKTLFKAQHARTGLMACRRCAPVPWSGRMVGRVVNSGGLLAPQASSKRRRQTERRLLPVPAPRLRQAIRPALSERAAP
ncbi:hypothetical protein [Alcaligenes sp. SDU_A2]|uniref:hypothetical protein n=1 Tax=Alcaligenes sp. SDU_A2 TaxID=3136634 RepID=UPI0031204EC0